MDDLQAKFVEVANRMEEIKEQYKKTCEELGQVMADLGERTMFQSEEGLVYKIQKPKGQFVIFKDLEYVRTKRLEETRGTLSKKEAQESGYDL